MHVKHISGFQIETADESLGSENIRVDFVSGGDYEDDLIRISSEQGEVVYSPDVLKYILKIADRIRFVESRIPDIDDDD